MPDSQPPKTRTTEEKLDLIVEYLHRMDRRDRLRTIGGTFRGILSIIPIAFFLFSIWYLYAHGQEVLQMISDEAAKSVIRLNPANTDMFRQLQQYMGR